MSVMILPSSEIIAIACFATHENINFNGEYLSSTTHSLGTTKACMQRLAEMLLAANIECFNNRYGEDVQDTISVTDAHASMPRPEPDSIARTLLSLIYNCDDSDGWDGSLQKKVIFAIQEKLLRHLVDNDIIDHYPQFEDGPDPE